MFWVRLVTTAVLAPIALGAVYYGFPFFHTMIAFMAAAVLWEFTQIVEKPGLSLRIMAAIAAAVAVVSISHFNVPLSIGGVALVFLVLLVTDKSQHRLKNSSVQAGLLCAALPAIGLVMAEDLGGPTTIFWVLAVVWGSDMGGYAVGRTIGGPRLAPVISPNKTWSGAAGGLALAIAATSVLFLALDIEIKISNVLYAAGLSIVSQVGDLAESRFKRQHKVKDSGNWLPGHGGVMDRVDGMWAVAPVVALLCYFHGGVAAW